MLNYLRSQRNNLFWSTLRKTVGAAPTKALDLGSGIHPKNDFLASEIWSLDIVHSESPHHVVCDASSGRLPLENDSFELVTAYDFLEHIPRVALINGKTTFPFIELMNEVSRILKPGGHFYSYTPVFPKKAAFQDPTHVNIMTKDTLKYYFSGTDPIARVYGFSGAFTLITSGWKGSHHYCLLAKMSS